MPTKLIERIAKLLAKNTLERVTAEAADKSHADKPRKTIERRRSAQRSSEHAKPRKRSFAAWYEVSGQLHVFGAGSLRTLTLDERYFLTGLQVLEADTFTSRHVEKYIFAGCGLDETKTLVRNPLDRAFAHSIHLWRNERSGQKKLPAERARGRKARLSAP
jgi:hypothetical protein